MMQTVKNFWNGLLFRHVSWNVRHNSRAYDIGGEIAFYALIFLPVAGVFFAGFAVGAMVGLR